MEKRNLSRRTFLRLAASAGAGAIATACAPIAPTTGGAAQEQAGEAASHGPG